MSVESDQKIHVLEQKIRDFPAEIGYHLSLGQQYLRGGRPDAAETAGQAAVQIDPGNPAGHFLLAES
jgi:cytochrome c-type biogenesis protein CcmH/NrfG